MRAAAILAALLLLAAGAAVWLGAFRPDGDATTGNGSIAVIAAPSSPVMPLRHEAPAAPAIAPVPDMDPLAVPERQTAFESRPRDETWAPRVEDALRQRAAGRIGGLSVDAIRCADILCRFAGSIAANTITDRQATVDALKGGPLDAAYGEARLSRNGPVVIDADDAGNLHFVQYLQRD